MSDTANRRDQALSSYRVLDLTDEKGYLCGRILGDLGADVIKIESPQGDPGRNIGPFYKDMDDPEKSLLWFAYNYNKRGITLDITKDAGKEILKKLVRRADFLIESFPPGFLDGLGLGYEDLRQVNERLIHTSITPFGQDGPYRDYKGPDLIGMALGGYLYLTGDIDRPPVRISAPQAYLHASTDAAVGTLMAHYHAVSTGEGQHVDVSMQQSVVLLLMMARPYWELTGTYLKRTGSFRSGIGSGALQPQTWPCKDGCVSYAVFGGPQFAPFNRAMVKWLEMEGLADEFITSIDWDTVDMMTLDKGFHDAVSERISKLFLSHTKDELYQGAIAHGLMLYPGNSIEDLLASPQLQSRGFWVEVEHPELSDKITYPGSFAHISDTPCLIRFRAPCIGEHNETIYGQELGMLPHERIDLKMEGVI
ncbi:MAG: CoA transferase [Dehalococcoidia bacterium]|nr:CoA transferase [Dehalococcoidia bacterium]